MLFGGRGEDGEAGPGELRHRIYKVKHTPDPLIQLPPKFHPFERSGFAISRVSCLCSKRRLAFCSDLSMGSHLGLLAG